MRSIPDQAKIRLNSQVQTSQVFFRVRTLIMRWFAFQGFYRQNGGTKEAPIFGQHL
jgi:hypothetical protein